MEEIEEVLSKDSRYHVLEVLNDDRADLLMAYLEELERKGPPPPPTASEPNRFSSLIFKPENRIEICTLNLRLKSK